MNPILIYLEDAPLGPGIAAAGLSKAFNPTFKGLVSDTTRVCVVQTHQLVDPIYFVDEWLALPAWAAPPADWVLARFYARLPWPLAYHAARIHGRWIAYRLRRAFQHLLPPGIRILAPIGSDPLTLVRADSLARSLSAHIEPYLVDDLQYHPANTRWQADVGNALSRLLSRATRVYSITDGLGALLHARHAVRPQTLHLVAASASAATPHAQRQSHGAFAFFLGSINHLYAQGLRLLIDQVAELRTATGRDLTIRVSSSSAQVNAELGNVPHWVLVGPIADNSQLYQEIADASFCFMPYTFAEEAKSMVESSFPSKMIDYLAHANAIVVFSPASAVPFRLLHEHNLPYVCANPTMLREHLHRLLEQDSTPTPPYRFLLDQLFSVAAMRRTLGFQDVDE